MLLSEQHCSVTAGLSFIAVWGKSPLCVQWVLSALDKNVLRLHQCLSQGVWLHVIYRSESRVAVGDWKKAACVSGGHWLILLWWEESVRQEWKGNFGVSGSPEGDTGSDTPGTAPLECGINEELVSLYSMFQLNVWCEEGRVSLTWKKRSNVRIWVR